MQKEAQLQVTRKEREKGKEKGKSGQGEKKRISGKSFGGHSSHGQDTGEARDGQSSLGGLKLPPVSQHAGGLLISHGKTENVSLSLIVPQKGAGSIKGSSTELHEPTRKRKKRRRQIVISDDEDEEGADQMSSSLTEDEPIDVVGMSLVNPFKHEQKPNRFSDFATPAQEAEAEVSSLVLHYDKQYYRHPEAGQSSLLDQQTLFSDSTIHASFQTDPRAPVNLTRLVMPGGNSFPGAEPGEEGGDELEKEREGARKAKKKKKKKKRKYESMEGELRGPEREAVEPLRLKIALGNLDPNTTSQ